MNNPTTAELAKALWRCATGEGKGCADCNVTMTHNKKTGCILGCAESLRLQAADRLEELEQELATLREQQRWIPVTERLPEALEIVLTICVDRRKNSEIHRRINCCDAIGEWLLTPPLYAVTHWMPLPEPPKEEHHEPED